MFQRSSGRKNRSREDGKSNRKQGPEPNLYPIRRQNRPLFEVPFNQKDDEPRSADTQCLGIVQSVDRNNVKKSVRYIDKAVRRYWRWKSRSLVSGPLFLPPVEFCRGTRPNHAANSRPLRKPLGSATIAATAVAMMGPMPGIVAKCWLTGLLLCQPIGCFSSAAIAASSCSICTASTCSTWRARPGRRASSSSRMIAISLPTLRNPCGAIMVAQASDDQAC